jgi:hypothetical protein
MTKITELYRYDSQRYSYIIDAEMDMYGVTDAKLELRTYKVSKETPCGYRIYWGSPKGKWVSKTSLKRYAHPTKEEAHEAYKWRKKSYVAHCEARLRRAKEDLALASPREEFFR